MGRKRTSLSLTKAGFPKSLRSGNLRSDIIVSGRVAVFLPLSPRKACQLKNEVFQNKRSASLPLTSQLTGTWSLRAKIDLPGTLPQLLLCEWPKSCTSYDSLQIPTTKGFNCGLISWISQWISQPSTVCGGREDKTRTPPTLESLAAGLALPPLAWTNAVEPTPTKAEGAKIREPKDLGVESDSTLFNHPSFQKPIAVSTGVLLVGKIRMERKWKCPLEKKESHEGVASSNQHGAWGSMLKTGEYVGI